MNDGRTSLIAKYQSSSLTAFGPVRARPKASRAGKKARPERAAAADEILPQPALAFMNPQRRRFGERRPEMLRRQPLLIHAVPRLVQDAEERLDQTVFVVSRGQPRVPRPEPGAEGVRADIKPTGGEVKADRFSGRAGKLPLRRHWGRPFQEVRRRLAAARHDPADQVDQRPPQALKRPADHLAGRPWLELVEQGVVRVGREPDARGFATLERKDLFKPGTKGGIVGLLPGGRPGLLAEDFGTAQFLHQVRRKLGRAIEIAPHLARYGEGVGVEALPRRDRLGRREQVADAGRSEPGVRQLRKQRDLVGPQRRPLFRHLRLLIPVKHRRRRSQQRDLTEFHQ